MTDFLPLPKANSPEVSSQGWTVVRGRADFGKVRYNATGRIEPALGASDGMQVLTIPANTFILVGYYKITVGEGAAVNCDVGSATGGSQYLSNTSLQTAGNWTVLTDPDFDSDAWDYSTSAIVVWVSPDAAMDTAVLDLMFICVPATTALIGNN